MNDTARAPRRRPRTPALRSEWQTARRVLRALCQDLILAARTARPLAPVRLPLPARWQGRGEPFLSLLPHLAVGATGLVLFVVSMSDRTLYDEPAKIAVGVFAGVPVVAALVQPMAAWWMSLAGLVLLTETNVADSFPTWPWTTPGMVGHTLVTAVTAARSRPRVSVALWLLTLAVGFRYEPPVLSSPNAVAGLLVACMCALVLVALLRGWYESRGEVVRQVAVTADERSRRTRLEERTTIARELHDVVAHHMSVVAIQAEAAPYRVEHTPPELAQAFATIRENALSALAELRRVLGVIRAEDYEAPDAPQPTLAALDGLLDNLREAGLPVEKAVTGAVRELPQGVELSAFRIVQEALSNALRHAPGAGARVELSYVLGGLGLRVVNGPPRGPVPPSDGAGHGIPGMRERVAMLGGELVCGAAEDGGWETAAFLPVPLEAAA